MKAGQEAEVKVRITGLADEENTDIQFEIRQTDNSGLPDLIEEVEQVMPGEYAAKYTFKEAAKYDVYIHLYNADIHMTKKKSLEVSE